MEYCEYSEMPFNAQGFLLMPKMSLDTYLCLGMTKKAKNVCFYLEMTMPKNVHEYLFMPKDDYECLKYL